MINKCSNQQGLNHFFTMCILFTTFISAKFQKNKFTFLLIVHTVYPVLYTAATTATDDAAAIKPPPGPIRGEVIARTNARPGGKVVTFQCDKASGYILSDLIARSLPISGDNEAELSCSISFTIARQVIVCNMVMDNKYACVTSS